jgi:hypothetical protein
MLVHSFGHTLQRLHEEVVMTTYVLIHNSPLDHSATGLSMYLPKCLRTT